MELFALVENVGSPRILVLGDVMLDRYTFGTADRVSPESPVAVLRAEQREVRLGGAASVAGLLRGLEADVTLVGVIGDDVAGRTLRRLATDAEVNVDALLKDSDRPTTTKERFLGRADGRQPQQVLRVDDESRSPLDEVKTSHLLDALRTLIPSQQAVLISDYGKGVCTEEIVRTVIEICRELKIPVLIDPARGVGFQRYRGATLLKPNRSEAEFAARSPIVTAADAIRAAEAFSDEHEVQSVVITLDGDGLVLLDGNSAYHEAIQQQDVCDITGAGDTVLAILGFGAASGWPLSQSVKLGNVAAGLQVEQVGVAPLSWKEINFKLSNSRHHDVARKSPSTTEKLVTIEELTLLAVTYRVEGKSVVFTNGCFDLLHHGHVATLQAAARHGDVLIVAVNSDESVRHLKGCHRPVVGEHERSLMLAALACVDHVVIFNDDTPLELLRRVRPNVLVKGGTTGQIVGREFVQSYGGLVVTSPEVIGHSTTALVSKIQAGATCTSQ